MTRFVRLEYDVDASVRLVIGGWVVKRWRDVDFIGWGHPLAPLFVRCWR